MRSIRPCSATASGPGSRARVAGWSKGAVRSGSVGALEPDPAASAATGLAPGFVREGDACRLEQAPVEGTGDPAQERDPLRRQPGTGPGVLQGAAVDADRHAVLALLPLLGVHAAAVRAHGEEAGANGLRIRRHAAEQARR